MGYIGHQPTNAGNFYELDDFNGLGYDGSSNYDQNFGSATAFKLRVGGVDATPNIQNLLIFIDGVLQQPTGAFSVSGSVLTFTEAPASGSSFYGIIMGQSSYVIEGTIGASELKVTGNGSSGQVLTSDGDGTFTWATDVENSIQDADGDTKIYTEKTTDSDQVKIDTGGTERVHVDSGDFIIQSPLKLGINVDPSYDVHAEKSTAGGMVDFMLKNSDTSSTSSGVRNMSYVGSGNSGDPRFVLGIGAVGSETSVWSWGIDNSDSDKLKLTKDSIVGSSNNVAMTINSSKQIGIGLENPSYLLDILFDGDAQFRVGRSASKNVAIRDDVMQFNGMTGNGMRILTTDSGYLRLGTNNTVDRLTINNNGQVAINDGNPQDTLQVDHATGTGGNTLSVNKNGSAKGTLFVEGDAGFGINAPTHNVHIKGGGNTDQSFFLIADSDDNSQFRIDSSSANGTPSVRIYDTSGTSTIVLNDGASIFKSGNTLGLGLDSDSLVDTGYIFHSRSTTNADVKIGQWINYTRTEPATIGLGRVNSTVVSPTAIANTGAGADTILGRLMFKAYSPSGGADPGLHDSAEVRGVTDANFTTNHAPGRLEFRVHTGSEGNGYTTTEAMRLNKDLKGILYGQQFEITNTTSAEFRLTRSSAYSQFSQSSDGGFLRLGNSSNTENVMIRSYGQSTFKGGTINIENNAPEMRLKDTDTNRFLSIYFGTRAANFDNFLHTGEDLSVVQPWFDFRFVDQDTNTYTSALKLDHDLKATFGGDIKTTNHEVVHETGFGYDSSTYKVIQFGGDKGGNKTISLGYDPSGNSNGSFAGSGDEILTRNTVTWKTPNDDNDGWHVPLAWNDGNVNMYGSVDIDGYTALGNTTIDTAYELLVGNIGNNANVKIKSSADSARLYLDAEDSSGEYSQIWFQAGGNTKAGIYGDNSGILRFTTNGSSESMQIDQHGTVVIQEHKTDPDSSKMLMKSTKSYTDDEYENFTLVGTSSLIIISDTTSNDGGVFFASYNSSNVTLIADPQSEFSAGDSDGRICCFKNGSTSSFQVKNRRGYTKNISVAVIGVGS